jgi:hypothetical protein
MTLSVVRLEMHRRQSRAACIAAIAKSGGVVFVDDDRHWRGTKRHWYSFCLLPEVIDVELVAGDQSTLDCAFDLSPTSRIRFFNEADTSEMDFSRLASLTDLEIIDLLPVRAIRFVPGQVTSLWLDFNDRFLTEETAGTSQIHVDGYLTLREEQYLSKLIQLRYLSVRLSDSELFILERLQNLESLDLSGSELGDIRLSAIANLPKLKSLYLGNTDIGDHAVASLLDCTELTDLSLSHTNITSATIANLSRLPHLERLVLAGIPVDSFSIPSDWPALREIHVTRDQFVGETEQQFVDRMKRVKVQLW